MVDPHIKANITRILGVKLPHNCIVYYRGVNKQVLLTNKLQSYF